MIAALERLRARINSAIAELEDGQQERAAEELVAAREEFTATMKELGR